MSRLVVVVAVALFSLCGCQGRWWHNVPGYGGYWWQRGQPKSVAILLNEANGTLNTSLETFSGERKEIAPSVKAIHASLTKAVQVTQKPGYSAGELSAQLTETERAMLELEGKLSVGSRAAYGELAAQLRTFTDNTSAGHAPEYAPFGLFASRTFRFLSSELSMPAPVL